MREIARQLSGVRIWDAFDPLCPGDPCSAFRGDQPLFFDGDHLSAYGQSVLYPALKNAIETASIAARGARSRSLQLAVKPQASPSARKRGSGRNQKASVGRPEARSAF
jgi:hypothetical protein